MIKNKVVRNIKLHQIGLHDPISEKLLNFLEDKLGTSKNPLNAFTSPDYPKFTFYGKSKDDLRFYQDEKNAHINIKYDGIWSFLESEFGINYEEVQEVTLWWVRDTLQLKTIHTHAFDFLIFFDKLFLYIFVE